MGPFSGSELLSFLQNNYEQKEQTNTHLVHTQRSSSRNDGPNIVDKAETPGIFIGPANNWFWYMLIDINLTI